MRVSFLPFIRLASPLSAPRRAQRASASVRWRPGVPSCAPPGRSTPGDKPYARRGAAGARRRLTEGPDGGASPLCLGPCSISRPATPAILRGRGRVQHSIEPPGLGVRCSVSQVSVSQEFRFIYSAVRDLGTSGQRPRPRTQAVHAPHQKCGAPRNVPFHVGMA
jgi:hypothetical protein